MFTWPLDELRIVKQSDYSNYYDQERMDNVNEQSYKMFKAKDIPNELIDMYKTIAASRKH